MNEHSEITHSRATNAANFTPRLAKIEKLSKLKLLTVTLYKKRTPDSLASCKCDLPIKRPMSLKTSSLLSSKPGVSMRWTPSLGLYMKWYFWTILVPRQYLESAAIFFIKRSQDGIPLPWPCETSAVPGPHKRLMKVLFPDPVSPITTIYTSSMLLESLSWGVATEDGWRLTL